ncbi:DUF4437 domain-containing protein [Alteromonas sp. ASW11-19]|uniref:DUF4437 domain-containing protein n=2 Tax=Alteromonas salexigens TaxID=2982530 RepID=A0ABT2VMU1_9ALTE|nr:DUF4437 domain-containing protein [Alteromonas salexigens]MCU7553783.1 DUF4437 domain-containing protein [Alteromonas salexigens]
MSMTTLPSKPDDHTVIATDDIAWGLLNPLRGEASPKAADLWGDRTKDMATGMLVKFNKGFSSPPHIHNITYRGIVIEGLMHNDDPSAEKMWLPPGSFWTQPTGENHVTAADGKKNLIYLEIDSGPYLVLSSDKAFDSGERPINIDERNLVWLSAKDIKWLNKGVLQIAYLWGEPHSANGSFVKIPAGFEATIKNDNGLKAVLVRGKATHQWNDLKTKTALSPSSFFSSKAQGEHRINAETEIVLYINSSGSYTVK